MKAPDWSKTELRAPHENLKDAFLSTYKTLSDKSDKSAWLYLGENADPKIPEQDFAKYVEALRLRQTFPPPGFVRDSTFWAIYEGQMLGRISVRHELNDFLKRVGGHIGFIVHPEWRNLGVASWMLAEILKQDICKSIGRLLLTCDESNLASKKTITKNGGVFEKAVELAPDRPKKLHFWITL